MVCEVETWRGICIAEVRGRWSALGELVDEALAGVHSSFAV